MTSRITSVTGRQLWDSRGRPTVEAEVRLASGISGKTRLQPFGGDVPRGSDGERAAGLARLHGADGLFKFQKARAQGVQPAFGFAWRGEFQA